MEFRVSSGASAQAYLAAIVESSDDAIISKDLDGVIQSCNAGAERIFGYTAEELVGQPVRMLIPIDRMDEEDEILRRIRRGERVDHFETIRIAKGRRPVHVSVTVSAVRNSDGVIVGASKVARDVSEQKRVAATLAAHASERERLLEAERAARSEAERANRVKDDFVAMVSHELRTPLNAILGWAHLMGAPAADDATRRRGLDVIIRNTKIQAQLVADLLDVSRMLTGKLEMHLQPVDLRQVVADALEAASADIGGKHMAVVQEIDDRPAVVAGDSGRLQQVVWNLLSNAIKFSSAGATIRIALFQDATTATITVADDGLGIRAEHLPYVFERFNQGDRSGGQRLGGLGLGLAIVKHIVERHGGAVAACSDGDGRGATFSVALPLNDDVDDSVSSRATTWSDSHSTSFAGVRVLVVEDEGDTSAYLSRLLEGEGASVSVAIDADGALQLLGVARYDVLISDIGLPGRDGYQLMREIRRRPDGRGMPAIATTAYARAEDRTHALRAGFQAHMAKPIDSAELVATIVALLELRRSEDPPREPAKDLTADPAS